MSAVLNYVTSGKMEIFLDGMKFGRHLRDPQQNVKHFSVEGDKIVLQAFDEGNFTGWGSIELLDVEPWEGYLMLSIDCDKWAFFGAAQFQLIINGQIVLSDVFHSGVRGPVGDPKKKKQYAIGNFK